MPTLAKYRKMRDFSRSQEPRGSTRAKQLPKRAQPKRAQGLSFVVQKHDARNLHYDFRLELDGVLLSWAVPKGPSLDPSVKRLAMEVEPHPLEYAGFEGTIPKGEYGGGTVMVWDRGSWTPEGDPHAALAKGHLSFSLAGEKLKGAWHLVRTKRLADDGHGKKGKGWLLFKSRDEQANDDDRLLADEPDSVLTGRNLEQIAQANDATWTRAGSQPPDSRPRRKPAQKPRQRGATKPPRAMQPELATLVDAAPEGDDWVHEIKLDGYRVLAHVDHGTVRLLTRNGKDWTDRMPTLRAALEQLKVDSAVLDGELVALDEHGVSRFQSLQSSLNAESDGALVYYAFDLLHLAGEDITERPLLERKSLLRELLTRSESALGAHVRFSAHVVGNGPAFFANACKLGLEGTIAKRASAPYRPGRGRDWLKIKCGKDQEFTIIGYTEPAGSRSHFGALLVATRQDGELVYAGKVGTGFSAASLKELHERLGRLHRPTPPLDKPPRGAAVRGVHWVEPELVAEIGFTETTSDGLLRHPTFKGLRDDKPAREVELEQPKSLSTSYVITNPGKILYPEQGITKQELLDYYALVAPRMLPHVANRPLTLLRCPEGRAKSCFFQKHPGKGTPAGLRSIPIREKDGKAPYSVIDDETGLFGIVQLGALEIHTWGSRADDFEHPDILVFDLDPDPALDYAAVITGAQTIRGIFEQYELQTFVKTTGGKGLHVCVPIVPELDWEQAKAFTAHIARALAERSPELYVATVSKARRTGKVFIDYLRNARGATFVAPYSTRAREGAPIATPLEWDELSPKLPPNHFNLHNVRRRLERLTHDPFAGLTTVRQHLPQEGTEP
ncbi:MAG TPA: DNA ligase D [Polyangiaceae bacterium]|nr:DNA ligase D [Polyangiaceae bacterium]